MTIIQILKKYKLKWATLQTVIAVSQVPENCSNERVAEILDVTNQHAGRRVITARDQGFIENAPTHPSRRNWQLTETGENLIKDLNK